MYSKAQNQLHSKMALQIKAAKRELFKRHREGGDLDQLIDMFCRDVGIRLSKLTSSEYYTPRINIPEADEPEGKAILPYPSENEKVLEAAHFLLHSPATPKALCEAVDEFFVEQSNKCTDENLWHSSAILSEILKTVPADELKGAGGEQ